MIKNLKQIISKLEKKPGRELMRISFFIFLISFLIGFSSGLFFRELRLNLLMTKQKMLQIEETKRMNNLLREFSQAKSFPQK